MSWNGFAVALALAVSTALPAAAQSALPGNWTLSSGESPDRVRLTIRVDAAPSDHSGSSADVDPGVLGLSQAQLGSGGERAHFTLAREAGSFVCDGWIGHGEGGGTLIFTPSSAYRAAMASLGYDLTPEQQASAATVDVTTAYTKQIESTGFEHLPIGQLLAFRALGIDEAYVRSLRSEFPGTGIDAGNAISMRALHVTAGYVDGLRAAGVGVASPANAVALKALRVDLDYVRALAAAGYPHLTADQLLQLRALHIDAAYVARVRAHGIKQPSVEELVRLKAMGLI
ncbi:MAG TPA: hypothetical protein VMF61_08260 [Candidatus Acidoferrales bacterium]|nr:hypothetical protein [Candidatus Acidoferrales bacterium]